MDWQDSLMEGLMEYFHVLYISILADLCSIVSHYVSFVLSPGRSNPRSSFSTIIDYESREGVAGCMRTLAMAWLTHQYGS